MKEKSGLPLFGLLLAAGLVISTFLVTDALKAIKMSNQIIKVRGYAETFVTSDTAVWNFSVWERQPSIKECYTKLSENTDRVLAFLSSNGFKKEDITISAANIDEIRKKDQRGYETAEILGYRINRGFKISGSDVKLVSDTFSKIDMLMKEGIEIHANSPSYYYSKLDTLKKDLLIKATEDAGERAEVLAKGSGVRLGVLKAARQGAFGVRSANSSEVSYEREYDDVASIEKKITSVVTVDYSMK